MKAAGPPLLEYAKAVTGSSSSLEHFTIVAGKLPKGKLLYTEALSRTRMVQQP
jgi:hypothetical protein